MSTRLNQTLFNWRWWVVLPLMVLIAPVALIDLALHLTMLAAELVIEYADATRDFLRALCHPWWRPLRAWTYRATPASGG